MAAFITEESKGRPSGAPEFLAYSPKNTSQVRLYCRPSFWHWIATEFDPCICDVRVNQVVLNLAAKRISVALQYESKNTTHLVFSKREIRGDDEAGISEYAEKNDIQCIFLSAKCNQSDQTYAENLICMLSYINKFKESLSDRNLDAALRAVDRAQNTVRGAALELDKKFPESSGALLFELVRRGRIKIADVQDKTICGSTEIKVMQVWHE